MNKKNLTKKDKCLLSLAAGLIAIAWFLPSILKAVSNNQESDNIIKKVDKSSPEYAVTKYYKTLEEGSEEYIKSELNSPLGVVSGFQIEEVSQNDKKATIAAKIYILNSYLKSTFNLTKEDQEWEIDSKEISNILAYSKGGITLNHSYNWEIRTEDAGDFQDAWKLTSEDLTTDIVFLIEGVEQNISENLTDCTEEQVTRCQEIKIGNNIAKTSLFNYEEMEIYVIERGGENSNHNLIIVIPNTVYRQEKEAEIYKILESIQV